MGTCCSQQATELDSQQNASSNAVEAKHILSSNLPSSEFLELIVETSRIAQDSGWLISSESQQISVPSQGIPFTVHLALNLSKKPKPKLNGQKLSKPFRDPFMPPFGDDHVCNLDDQYRILLNKYNFVANHILIVSKEFVPQHEPLLAADFGIAMKVIHSMDGLCYFNCGPLSGASQPHKHLQVIPRNKKFPIEILVDRIETDNSNTDSHRLYRIKEYAFIHRVFVINQGMTDGERLHSVYIKMLNEMKSEMMESEDYAEYLNDDVFSYNLILSADYMFVVVRRSEIFKGDVTVGSLEFTGNLFAKSQEGLSLLRQADPISVLQHVSCPVTQVRES